MNDISLILKLRGDEDFSLMTDELLGCLGFVAQPYNEDLLDQESIHNLKTM